MSYDLDEGDVALEVIGFILFLVLVVCVAMFSMRVMT